MYKLRTSCLYTAGVILIAVLGFAIAAAAQTTSERDALMNVGGKPPTSLAEAGISILHGLPRANGAKNQLGSVNPDDDAAIQQAKDYAIGVILPIGICFGLGVFTWVVCFGFCMCRGCCNTCGRRWATRQYLEKERTSLKVLIVFLGAVSVVLFGIGLVTNAAVSSSLDDAYVRADQLVEYLYLFHTPLNAMSLAAADALTQVQSINTTLLAQLPTDSASYIQCSNNLYTGIQQQQYLLQLMRPLVNGFVNPTTYIPQDGDWNLTSLSLALNDFQSQVQDVPDLTQDTSMATDYKTSLVNNLPSPIQTAAYDPSRQMASAQSIAQQGSTVADEVQYTLNPALVSTNASINPLRYRLLAYPVEDLSAVDYIIANLSAGVTTQQFVQQFNQFNLTVGAIPDPSQLIQSVNAFQMQATALRSALSDSLSTVGILAESIVAIGNGSSFQNLVTELRTSVGSITHDSNLAPQWLITGAALNALDTQVVVMLANVEATTAGVAALADGTDNSDPTSVLATIQGVNASLPTLTCMKSVLTHLAKLNSTVMDMPPNIIALLARRSQLTVQLQRTSRILVDLRNSTTTLASVAANLQANFPDLSSSVTPDLNSLATALAAYPDNIAAANQVQALDDAFAALTDDSMASVLAGVPAFVGNLTIHSSRLSVVQSYLIALESSLSAIPTDFTQWTDFATAIAQAVQDMKADLAETLVDVNSPYFASNGIDEPLRTNIQTDIQKYRDVTRPTQSFTSLSQQLSQLHLDIDALHNNQGDVTNRLRSLQPAALALSSTQPIALAMKLAYQALTQAPLQPLLDGSVQSNMQNTLSTQPDYSSVAQQVSDAQQSAANAQGGSFTSVANDMAITSGFISEADYAVLLAVFNAMEALLRDFPDMAYPIQAVSTAAHGLNNAASAMKDYRHEYYVARQTTVVFKNHIDWLRLLGFMLVLFVPFCVALCGFYAWRKTSPRASMYMGLCSFSIIAILFIMAAVQMIPAILFVDQCSDVDGFLQINFANYGLAADAAQPWINFTRPIRADEIFNWFHACEGPEPELIDVLANPRQVLESNNINFTNYRYQVLDNLNLNNNTLTLKPNVWDSFNALDADVQSVIDASATAHDFFVNCSSSEALWTPFRQSVCSSQGVSGAIALSTVLSFLFAICMIPGVCVGIIGYKRFDPNYLKKVEEPEAVVPARQHASPKSVPAPLITPMSPGGDDHARSIASPSNVPVTHSHEYGGMASPSLAMAPYSPPVNLESIELMERRQSIASQQQQLPQHHHLQIASPSHVTSSSNNQGSFGSAGLSVAPEGSPSPSPSHISHSHSPPLASPSVAVPVHAVSPHSLQVPVVALHARGGSGVVVLEANTTNTAEPEYEYE